MTTKRSSVRLERVLEGDAGRRLDNFLLARLKDAPKSLVYKLVRSGQVRVNGGRVKPDYRLLAADEVRIPPVEDHSDGGPLSVPAARVEQLERCVLYEDAHYIVLDKPAGLACHGGSGLRYGAIELARAMRPQVARLDLAHRLDRDTSGCLVLCKDMGHLRAFHDALRDNRVSKRYVALLRGQLPADLARIELALGTVRGADGERRSAADERGKLAETVIESCQPAGPHTLAQLRLVTGRMHQIRAHALEIGHPVAGDPRYGQADFNASVHALGLRRLFLHACRVEFTAAGQRIAVEAPLPDELATVVSRLQSAA